MPSSEEVAYLALGVCVFMDLDYPMRLEPLTELGKYRVNSTRLKGDVISLLSK